MTRITPNWDLARIAVLAPFLATGLLSTAGYGQDASTITVPYSAGGNRTLGDAVNIVFPHEAIGRCVSYDAADVKWDTGGAISSIGTVEIAQVSNEEKRTTNVSLGYQASAKAKAGILSANSKFDTSISTESFSHDADNSITLVFSASADYGRRMIEDYALKSSVPDPKVDPESFRKACGTHFIRGQRRTSDLTIMVRITSATRAGKDALTLRLSQTLGGGVSLKAVTGEAGATFTSTYGSILEYARKTGSIGIEYNATGGPGISAAGASAKAVDPTDFTKLGEIASSVSSLFTQENSNVVEYILQSNTAFGADPEQFDIERIETIGEMTRHLLMLNDARGRYQELADSDPGVFKDYFSDYSRVVDIARADVVGRIQVCAAGGECVKPDDDALSSLHFLEKMFLEAEVSISCQYQPASGILPIVFSPAVVPQVLESISINVRGVTPTPDLVDFSSSQVVRLTPEMLIEDVSTGFSGFAISDLDEKGQATVFGTVYSKNILPASALSFDAQQGRYVVDNSELQRRRDAVLDSAYSIFAPGPNGLKVAFDVGFPPRQDCPISK